MHYGKSKKKVRLSISQKIQPGLEFKMKPKPEVEIDNLDKFNKLAYIRIDAQILHPLDVNCTMIKRICLKTYNNTIIINI